MNNNTDSVSVNAEFERVKTLNSFGLDYNELQEEFQNITKLAAHIAGTSISLINLIDNYTQWTISSYGFELKQIPRENSICLYTIAREDYLEIQNITEDERFAHKTRLKYYLGLPLKTDSGDKIGTLCILDAREKSLEDDKIEQLKMLADEIVDRLTLKRELKRSKREINEVLFLKNKVAHDVRSPISSILALTKLAAEEDQLSLLEAKSYLKKIERSSETLMDLTAEILAPNKDSKFYQPEKISVRELEKKIISLYGPQAENKNIEFKVSIGKGAENTEILYSNVLQIIGNLVSNAIKFTPPQGKVDLNLDVEGEMFKIRVSDSGKGISPEKINMILEGGAISGVGTSGEIGYGLGLKIVKNLIDEVKGKINISSAGDAGSIFMVEIPQL